MTTLSVDKAEQPLQEFEQLFSHSGKTWHMFRWRRNPIGNEMDFLSECGRIDFTAGGYTPKQERKRIDESDVCGACLFSVLTRK